MTLEPYFRRQANRFAEMALSGGDKIGKLARQAMDLIFGFLAGEMKSWVDGALQRDQMSVDVLLPFIRLRDPCQLFLPTRMGYADIACLLTSFLSGSRQIVGIMAVCERLLTDSEDRNCDFLIKLFQKQLQRLNHLLDQFIVIIVHLLGNFILS